MKRRSKVLHLDDILNRSDFQSQVQRQLLINFEAKILREGGKIWSLHLHFIFAGQKPGDLEDTLLIAGGMAFRSRAYRRELHGRSRKGPPLRVGDGSANYGVVALGQN